MDYFNSAKFLNAEIRREVQTDHRFPPVDINKIEGSISHTIGTAYANGTIFKINLVKTDVDAIQYAYKDTKSEINNSNLSTLNKINDSRTARHHHNAFKSDYVLIDY